MKTKISTVVLYCGQKVEKEEISAGTRTQFRQTQTKFELLNLNEIYLRDISGISKVLTLKNIKN